MILSKILITSNKENKNEMVKLYLNPNKHISILFLYNSPWVIKLTIFLKLF